MRVCPRLFVIGLLMLSPCIGLAEDWPPAEALTSSNRREAVRSCMQVEDRFGIENLSEEEFRRYARALEAGDCAVAREVVRAAHVKRDRGFAALQPNAEAMERWAGQVIQMRFPELAFCFEKAGVSKTVEEIVAEGGTVTAVPTVLGYWDRIDTDGMSDDAALLVAAVQLLSNIAFADNPDAIRFLLQEDAAGRAVALTDAQRLQLLLRLKHLGVASEQEVEAADALAGRLDPGTAAKAHEEARREIMPEFERWQAFRRQLGAEGGADAIPSRPWAASRDAPGRRLSP